MDATMTDPRTAAPAGPGHPRAVYDELFGLLSWWRSVPTAAALDDDIGVARAVVAAEARLLDDDRLEDWLEGWSRDGVLWVPLDPAHHPATDQAYYLDDRRRLGERIGWRRQPSAWSQSPPTRTVRVTGSIESRRAANGELWIRSAITIVAHRREPASWAGHQFHVLGAPDGSGARLLRRKVLCMPALRASVPDPTVLL